jgi:hypothetical protein
MRRRGGVTLREVLNSGWSSVSKGVNALIVVASNEGDDVSTYEFVYELLVNGI